MIPLIVLHQKGVQRSGRAGNCWEQEVVNAMERESIKLLRKGFICYQRLRKQMSRTSGSFASLFNLNVNLKLLAVLSNMIMIIIKLIANCTPSVFKGGSRKRL